MDFVQHLGVRHGNRRRMLAPRRAVGGLFPRDLQPLRWNFPRPLQVADGQLGLHERHSARKIDRPELNSALRREGLS